MLFRTIPVLFVFFQILFLLAVVAVVAQVFRQLSAFHIKDPSRSFIEEVTVMGYDKARPAKSKDGIFHDFSCRYIQMVCRFIQNQEIRSFKEKTEKGKSCLFSP